MQQQLAAALATPAAFAQLVATHLQQQGADVQPRNDHELLVRMHDRDVRMNLAPAYQVCRASPERVPAVLAHLGRMLHTFRPAQLETDFAQLRGAVIPLIKPLSLLYAIFEQELPQLVYEPLVETLMVCYVVEEGASLAYINNEHLAAWGIKQQLLHAQAVTNLRARPLPEPNVLGDGARRTLVYSDDRGYASSLLLLPEQRAGWHRVLGQQLLVGVPHRDLLVVFPAADAAFVQLMTQQIQTDMLTHPAGLSEQVLHLTAGELRASAAEH